jgi:MFS family permease
VSSAPAPPVDGDIAGRGTFRALRVPNYRRYAGANLISQTGTWMQRIGQDWLVLQISHGSGVALGVITALQFGPSLLSMVGGVLADRYDKRRLLMITQTLMGILALVLGILVATDVIALWHVFVLAAGLEWSPPSTSRSVSRSCRSWSARAWSPTRSA